MKFNYPYLNDFTFLKTIDNSNNKTQKVKITILDFQENPIKEIQGRVTGGAVNFDGSSSMRRTLNLSLIADDYNENLMNVNNLLSINKKIGVEIGFINNFNKYEEYDIIWFPMGIFILFNPNCTHSKEGLSISLQAKDKMCLLNGECGGTIPASVVFHEIEDYDFRTGKSIIQKPLIFDIIKELVHHHGNELLTNIVINDVPNQIKRALKWSGNTPLYLIEEMGPYGVGYYPSLQLPEENQNYREFTARQEVGFEYTDFTYPGDLICNAGETVCSVLDKIKSVLGNFEYFYDINGTFVFQEIRNYLNTTEATTILNDVNQSPNYIIDRERGRAAYVFDSHNLIESFSNAPQYNAIKNDFVVWGERKNAAGNPMPIRYHLAIDKKPQVGNEYTVGFYIERDTNILKAIPVVTTPYDFKDQIIEEYQDRLYKILEPDLTNGWAAATNTIDIRIDTRKRGKLVTRAFEGQAQQLYEYTLIADMNKFTHYAWRGKLLASDNSIAIEKVYLMRDYKGNINIYLLEPFSIKKEEGGMNLLPQFRLSIEASIEKINKNSKYFQYAPEIEGNYIDVTADYEVQTIITQDWREELYYSGLFADLNGTDRNYYYAELSNEWPKLWNLKEQVFYDNVKNSGTELDYFLDFIDIHSALGGLCVDNIGRRSKIISEKNVNCIFEPVIPDLLWKKVGEEESLGQICINVNEAIYKQMTTGGSYNSAFYHVQDLLYQHTSYNESITVVTQPIYYLEPNTLISVSDVKSGIYGDYLIKSFSIPLTLEGNMNLSCIKPLEKI